MATKIFTVSPGGADVISGGFRNPLGGMPRREPSFGIPPLQSPILPPAPKPPSMPTAPAGGGIDRSVFTSASINRGQYVLDPSATLDGGGLVGTVKRHWPWLVVGGLVVAALVVK